MIQHILQSRKIKYKCCKCIEITDDRLKKINKDATTANVDPKKLLDKRTDATEDLNELIDDRFEEFERKTLKKIENLIQNTNKGIDNTIKETYSEVVKKINVETQIKTVMNEDRKSRLKEAQDTKIRGRNIIIHNLDDGWHRSFHLLKQLDTYAVNELLKTTDVKADVKYMYRLGKKTEGVNRPLKVVLGSEEERNAVLKNLFKLKGHTHKAPFYGAHISRDLTSEERKLIKRLHDEAKKRNEKQTDYVWRVRDSSTKGPYLRRYAKEDI